MHRYWLSISYLWLSIRTLGFTSQQQFCMLLDQCNSDFTFEKHLQIENDGRFLEANSFTINSDTIETEKFVCHSPSIPLIILTNLNAFDASK